MTRIATSMIAQNALIDLQRAQTAMYKASSQTASQNTAEDMKGYGAKTQTLVSSQRLSARLESRIGRDEELNTRMTIQDTSLEQAAEVISSLRDTLTEAVGLGAGSGVDDALQSTFLSLKDAFNANLNGRYLFGGTLNDQQPVQVDTLDDLAATTDVTEAFVQGAIPQEVKIDAVLTIETAPMASQSAESSMDILRTLKIFSDSVGGFTDPMTDAQKDELKTALSTLDAAYSDLLSAQGANGQSQNQINKAIERQTNQLNALNQTIGEIVDVDLAEVALQLNQAQLSYEASASVFNSLKSLSLLDFI